MSEPTSQLPSKQCTCTVYAMQEFKIVLKCFQFSVHIMYNFKFILLGGIFVKMCMLFQKTSIFLPQMGLDFPGVVVGKVSVRQKILKRCTLHVEGSIEISRGMGGCRKKSRLLGRYGYYFSGRTQSGSINRAWGPELCYRFTHTLSFRILNINVLEVVCRRNDLLSHLMDHPGDWTPVVTDWLLHLVTRGLGKRVEMLCFKPQTPLQVN